MNHRSFFITFILILSLGIISSSCRSTDYEYQEDEPIDYIPVQISKGSPWVFVDNTGTQIGSQSWELEPTVSKNGVFIAQVDSNLIVYKWNKDVAEPVEGLTNLVEAGRYNEGVIPVCGSMERIRVVNAKGETLFTLNPIDGYEIISCSLAMQNGMLIITDSRRKYGAVDKEGNLVIKPEYDLISDFSDGVALAMKRPDDDDDYSYADFFVVDKSGKATNITPKISCYDTHCGLDEFSHGYCYIETYDETTRPFNFIKISRDGKASRTNVLISQWSYLYNGSYIETINNGESTSYVWKSAKGKIINTFTNGICYCEGKFVCNRIIHGSDADKEELLIYNLDGDEIAKYTGDYSVYCHGNKFGLIVAELKDWEPVSVIMIDENGKEIPEFHFANCGISLDIELDGPDELGDCGRDAVYSTYIDLTSADTSD